MDLPFNAETFVDIPAAMFSWAQTRGNILHAEINIMDRDYNQAQQ
jgi:hypothetical protein